MDTDSSLMASGVSTPQPDCVREQSSFRDPCGWVEMGSDRVIRRINKNYLPQVKEFLASELYRELVASQKILEAAWAPEGESLIQRRLPYRTYSSEWSFSMLKDAALLTLDLAEAALRHGYFLKDASSSNILFDGCIPLHVDLFSFEPLRNEFAWPALEQFCLEFLNPLILEAETGVSIQNLLRGTHKITTAATARLIPFSTLFRFRRARWTYLKNWIESRIVKHTSPDKPRSHDAIFQGLDKKQRISVQTSVLKSLRSTISGLASPLHRSSNWIGYHQMRLYDDAAVKLKLDEVRQFLALKKPKCLLDYGANNGEFSKLATDYCRQVVAVDSDSSCIDQLYCAARQNAAIASKIVPAVLDLSSPTPATGWNSGERPGFLERVNCDAFVALAIIHHLRFSSGIPISQILEFFSQRHAVGAIEYVRFSDPMVGTLLAGRTRNWFGDYEESEFRKTLEYYFKIERETQITSDRVLFQVASRRV